MTTGTITQYNPTRGTGTVTCTSGGRFPFTSRAAGLAVGTRTSFRAVGGRTGLYALDVSPLDVPVRRATAQQMSPWQPPAFSTRLALQ